VYWPDLSGVNRNDGSASVPSLLNDKSPEDTREIWEIFNRDNYLSMMLVDRIWLGENTPVGTRLEIVH